MSSPQMTRMFGFEPSGISHSLPVSRAVAGKCKRVRRRVHHASPDADDGGLARRSGGGGNRTRETFPTSPRRCRPGASVRIEPVTPSLSSELAELLRPYLDAVEAGSAAVSRL